MSDESYFPDQPDTSSALQSKNSLLPVIENCDTFVLPSGPWQASDCKVRQQRHQQEYCGNLRGGEESALDDREDELEPVTAESLAKEFIVPFFLILPISTESKIESAPTHSRRSSSSSLTRPTFRLTPLATTSSPTIESIELPTISSIKSQPIGFLRPAIVKALIEDNKRMISMNCKPVWSFLPPINFERSTPSRRPSGNYTSRPSSRRNSQSATPEINGINSERKELKEVLMGLRNANEESGDGVYAVGFENWVNEEGTETRSEHMDRISRTWKMEKRFSDQLDGWRNEHYNIYGPVSASSSGIALLPGSNIAFRLERAACSLFGVCTFGVHLTAYIEQEGKEMQIWVPKRSATKQTWPSYLDNSVAGGITAGDGPLESIIRECEEEASLDPEFVAANVRATSVVIYTTRTALGWISPEVQYVYDLKLPSDGSIIPSTNAADGEVEKFDLMGIEEIMKRALAGEFKPNCGMVIVDFLVRHGYSTFETDGRYLEVVSRLRRELTLPGPI